MIVAPPVISSTLYLSILSCSAPCGRLRFHWRGNPSNRILTHAVRAVALAGAVGDDSAGGQGQRNEHVLVALYGAVIAAPSLNYAEWRKRAREKLNGPTTMREK